MPSGNRYSWARHSECVWAAIYLPPIPRMAQVQDMLVRKQENSNAQREPGIWRCCPYRLRRQRWSGRLKKEANLKLTVQLASVFGLGVIIGAATIPTLSAQLRTQTDKRLITVDLAGFCD